MEITFENLGSIENGSIELNDLTLLCGQNNSGKTYAMYSLYSLFNKKFSVKFDFIESAVDELSSKGFYSLNIKKILSRYQKEIIFQVEECFKSNLSNLFGVKKDEFIKTTIKLHLNDENLLENIIQQEINLQSNFLSFVKEEGKEIIQLSLTKVKQTTDFLNLLISLFLMELIFTNPSKQSFLLPAERAGLNLFYKELFSIRNASLQRAQNDNIDSMDILKDILNARYAQPVKDYMQFLNEIGLRREETSDFSSHAQLIQSDVLGGSYDVDEHSNIFFTPTDSKNKLPLHFASSTVKTLFGLVFYLKHLAMKGDCLMIDEPELNLHPDNQRKVARVIAQLVNKGLQVVISTHSNYFIREINNLIMLKNDFSGVEGLRKKYKYQENELLDYKKVSAYLFHDKKIIPMDKDDEGIIVETFDTVTNAINQSSNEIYYAMQDAKEIDT